MSRERWQIVGYLVTGATLAALGIETSHEPSTPTAVHDAAIEGLVNAIERCHAERAHDDEG